MFKRSGFTIMQAVFLLMLAGVILFFASRLIMSTSGTSQLKDHSAALKQGDDYMRHMIQYYRTLPANKKAEDAPLDGLMLFAVGGTNEVRDVCTFIDKNLLELTLCNNAVQKCAPLGSASATSVMKGLAYVLIHPGKNGVFSIDQYSAPQNVAGVMVYRNNAVDASAVESGLHDDIISYMTLNEAYALAGCGDTEKGTGISLAVTSIPNLKLSKVNDSTYYKVPGGTLLNGGYYADLPINAGDAFTNKECCISQVTTGALAGKKITESQISSNVCAIRTTCNHATDPKWQSGGKTLSSNDNIDLYKNMASFAISPAGITSGNFVPGDEIWFELHIRSNEGNKKYHTMGAFFFIVEN